jgi:signal transduction histidine kinase
VRNVVTHSEARTLRLALHGDGQRAVLIVEDDGRGFEADEVLGAKPNGHFGLRLLSEMASDSGAVLTIDSQPGQGTRLFLQAVDR